MSSLWPQEKSLTLLRNLCYGKPEEIRKVFEWSGGQVFEVLKLKLDPARETFTAVREQALYTVCNIASGGYQSAAVFLGLGQLHSACSMCPMCSQYGSGQAYLAPHAVLSCLR